MKKISLLLLSLFFAMACFGQQKDVVDQIRLKDGNTIHGQIIEWVHNEYVIIKLESGTEVKFPYSDITKISQNFATEGVKKEKKYEFQEKGWFNQTSFDASLNEQSGFGFNHAVGYQFNRLFGLGVGSGFHSYTFNDDKRFIPVYLEARSFLLRKNNSPFISLKAGYGFALTNDASDMIDAKGGYLIYPEVGYRLGASKGPNFFVGMGVKLQKGVFTYEFPWNETTNVDTLHFERLALRLGITF